MTIKCKHYQIDEENSLDRCNILKNELYFESIKYYDSKKDACVFTKSIVCKYYEPKEEEKYALFAETVTLIPICGSNDDYFGCFGNNKEVKTQIQLTDPMTLDELIDKAALWMNYETSWLKNVVVKKVESK